jgi:hypothetical protein
MGDTVHVAYGDDQAATARALLDAAEALDLDAAVVQLDTEHGDFTVPEEVASKAKGVKAYDPHEEHATKVAEAIAAKEDADSSADSEQTVMQRTLSQPDPDAAQEAVGNIDPGPSDEEAYEKQLEASPPTEPDKPAAKKAAAKRPARKRAAKKSTAKKATAQKGY